MKKLLAILLILCCALPAAAKKRQNEEIITPLTQLEKRLFQTKTYPAQDNVIVMKALLNVLQDEGFIVYNVNSLLGFIYGVKDFDLSDPNIDISKEFGLTKSRLNYNGVKVATLEMSANITQYGDKSRVRVNFKRKLLNEYGNAQMIDDIEDVAYYEEFYSKVDNAINLQKNIQEKLKKETPASVKKSTTKTKPIIKIAEPESTTEQDSQIVEPDQEKTNVEDIKNNTEEKPSVESNNATSSLDATEAPSIVKEPIENKNSENITVSTNEEKVKTSKEEKLELKQQLKQAKIDAKQAKKDAKQAATDEKIELKQQLKQAKVDAKQAKKDAKQAAKDEKIELKQQLKQAKIDAKQAKKEQKEALKAAKKQAKEEKE